MTSFFFLGIMLTLLYSFNCINHHNNFTFIFHDHPLQQYLAMAYQMKKALRKTTGTKSYAQLQQDIDINAIDWQLKEREKQMQKESIFQNKNWSTKEKVKLMIFLSYYHGLPDWLSERRSIHLYKHLSNFLKKTRTPEQCKNIHSLLKRKFSNLQSVLRAMINELSFEQNYDKLVNKYQRDIQKFQSENNLLDAIVKQGYEPLISCFKPSQNNGRRTFTIRDKSIHSEDDLKLNLTQYIKFEEKYEYGSSKKKRQQLSELMEFYFQQWVKCMCVLQQMKEKTKE